MRKKVYIHGINAISPLGFTLEEQWQALVRETSGIQLLKKENEDTPLYASCIDTALLSAAFEQVSTTNAPFTCLEQMLILALQPLVDKYGIQPATGLILSTTKGNISLLENQNIHQAFLSILGHKIAQYFHFPQTPVIVSNACVSGVLSVALAKRLMQMHRFDNVYVLAGDEVTEFVLSGFQSFQAMSNEPCRPFDEERKGVTLGEAAAAVYLSGEREGARAEVAGDGSYNDANHISGPSRTGEGLFLSIEAALCEASVQKAAIDFISAHGTATPYNDEMEAVAFNRLQLQHIPVHSLKGYFGHTLGASGLLEMVFLLESMRHNQTIVSKGFRRNGVTQPLNIVTTSENTPIDVALKTASGFGGCNAAVILKKCTYE